MPARTTQNLASNDTAASAPSNRTLDSSSFSPRARTLGEGVPGFRTSFDVSGKGGGAFKPISENFSVSPANGTMAFSLPIHVSQSRGDYGPKLALAYDSGAGNGSFGFGWSVPLLTIHHKTAHGIPRYVDEDDLAVSGADIVRQLKKDGTANTRAESGPWGEFEVAMYRLRVDSGNMRVERWSSKADPGDVHWRTITSDNETTIYGDSDDSRILNTSGGSRHIFSWMPSRSWDAWGNAMEYTYKPEDGKGIAGNNGFMPTWEVNRSQEARCRQKYIKRIRYGNRAPNRHLATWEASEWPKDWMFEVVFDYGEHSQDSPSVAESGGWLVRQDAFSQSHAGFEVRTYRLCRRVLMFHHFPRQTKQQESLVTSTSMQYEESPQRAVLTSFTMTGHSIDKHAPAGTTWYKSESLPTWSFQYTAMPKPSEMATFEANVINLLDLPGSRSKVSEWLDLDGEGMPGLLTRTYDGTLCYQRNTGLASGDKPQFREPVLLAQNPSMKGGTFQDLDRNRHLDYVLHDENGRLQGFFERGDSDTWSSYSNFPETPNGAMWQDTVEIDLTGDGLADVLCAVDESQALIWQQNLGKKGLSGYQLTFGADPSNRPRLARTSDIQTCVADMTGSGQSDLVEVSAASVRYWPNLGHGNFGAVVEMGNCPMLSSRDDFDHGRVRLIDVDGSGTTDLLYLLPSGGAALYFNLAGNSWSDKVSIPQLPMVTDPSSVFTLDIRGRGTACLCWSDTLSNRNIINCLDLMGATKPHLLESYSNGLGAATSITYTPSTKFYVEDEKKGQPWSTKLPFPVQCISKVEVTDTITGNQRYTEDVYHNGCYNQVEKQFAGFEMVEVFHGEKLVIGEGETYEPPITHTKSWFSVGLSLEIDEFRFLTKSAVASSIQDLIGDPAECLQALQGVSLRSEVYSLDGTAEADFPFQIQELSHEIKLLQQRGPNKYSVVQVNPKETLSTEYERNMQDPRITHDLILKTNPFGEVEESLHVVYPRSMETAFSDVNENQKAGNMSYKRVWFTDEVRETYNFRKPASWKQQEHEILKFPFTGTLNIDQARAYDYAGLPEAKSTATCKALRNESRAFYQDSLLQERLAEGKLQANSLLDQTYALAFTPEIQAKIQSGLDNCNVSGSVEDLLVKGKYVKLENSNDWWLPSSRSRFCRPGSAAGQELEQARKSFFTPQFFVDVFGNVSRLEMDEDFLLAKETEDAMGNVSSFENDYEHLQPVKIIDPNLNTMQTVLGALGQSIAFAALGKGSKDEEDVDSLEDMELEVSLTDLDSIFFDPTGEVARRVLGKAGSRTVHCINRYALWKAQQDARSFEDSKINQASTASNAVPAFSVNMTRARPFGRSSDAEISVSISYMNGLGVQFQEVFLNDPNTFDKMWLVPGLSISDAQGHVVCAYQPRFANSPVPIPAGLMKTKTTMAFYDAMGRGVASLTPDNTWSKMVHTPRMTAEYNAGDMILDSKPQDDTDVGHFFARIPAAKYSQSWYDKWTLGTPQERRAAEKSAIYANAPLIIHIGSCGLPIRAVRVAGGETYTRRSAYDVSGNRIRDIDSYDRLVERMVYDKLGRQLQSTGMDQGESWALQDAQGGELLSWNCRENAFTTRYDGLRREIGRLVHRGDEVPKLVVKTTYGDASNGEASDNATALNLKNQVWKVEDQAGVHVSIRYDIRGHCLEQTFQAHKEYKSVVDWNVSNALEETVHTHTYTYDNFGQVVEEKDAQANRTRRRFTRQGDVYSVEFSSIRDSEWKPYLSDASFSADGLPMSMAYGNKVMTNFTYDDESRQLISQRTTRGSRGRREILVDLTHTYDCAGRRVFTFDGSEQVKYFRESRIKPEWDYTYDVAGRLVSASGRAQLSATPGKGNQLNPYSAMNGLSPSRGVTDGTLLYQYVETYKYDREGNMLQMKHDAPNAQGVTGWTRSYFYEEQSLLSDDPGIKSNRLSRTAIGGKDEGKHL